MTKTLYPTNLQLLHEIESILAAPSAQAMDTDKLEACLMELQERAPIAQDYDVEQAWEQVQTQLETESQETPVTPLPRSKSASRTVRILIAVAAVLAAIMVTAAAFGMKSFLRLVSWEDDRIIFQTILSDEVINRYNQITVFETLEDALAAETRSVDLLPSQLPEGYMLDSVTRTKHLGSTTYTVKYHNGEDTMRLSMLVGDKKAAIYLVPSAAQAYTYHKNDIDFTVYALDGNWHALWNAGTVTYSLSAPISEAELLAMLDSVD